MFKGKMVVNLQILQRKGNIVVVYESLFLDRFVNLRNHQLPRRLTLDGQHAQQT